MMKTCTILAFYWILPVVAIYANRIYNRKKNHCMSIVEWKIVSMKTSFWRRVDYHAFTVLLDVSCWPFGYSDKWGRAGIEKVINTPCEERPFGSNFA